MNRKKLFLLLIVCSVFIVTGCTKISRVNNQPATLNNAVQEKIDASDWQTFDEGKNGVSFGVLSNFKYPKNWYTYNFAGGTVIEIFFSDGGNFINQNLSDTEIVSKLYYTENGDKQRSDNNECKLSVFYNGADNSYSIKTSNTKNDSASKQKCESILTLLKEQTLKK